MEKRNEQLYICPEQTAAVTDSAAIQTAVNEAKRLQVGVVVIPPKADASNWKLTQPILLPSYITVIISGCTVESEGTAFQNENADLPATRNLGGEQHKIFLLGRKGGTLLGTGNAPQIRLSNARDCRVAGLTFKGGTGLELNYLQYSKLQMLTFRDCIRAVTYTEGCNNIIMESVDAETLQEAILVKGGSGRIPVRFHGIHSCIFCRLRVKTQGAPAVAMCAGMVPLYNIVVRDVTDQTQADGVSVRIGDETDPDTIHDLTIRGVQSNRDAVHTAALCDGMFYSNLHPGQGFQAFTCAWKNTRELVEDKTMAIVLPEMRQELPDRKFVTPNDPRFFADGDGQTIQNAVDYASRNGINCVVIPCWNVRAQQPRWDIERAIRLPSYMTVVLLHAHLRHTDFMYENLFTNSLAYDFEDRCMAKEEHDLTICGVGDAVLDGGRHNGLKEKTCFLFGLPDKRLNATVLFNNVRNMVLENFQIRNSRWYGTYFIHCDTVRISGLDFDNGEDECNRDGVDIRQGNHNFLVENITGTTGDDTVALNNLGNDGNDGRYVAGKDCDTLNMVIRNVKSDAGRWFIVRLLCQDRHLEQNFTLDTIMDVSLVEDQDHVDAVVMVGSHEYHYKIPAEVGDLAHLTIRDVYSRANFGVALAGCSDDVDISNIHTYADGLSALGIRGPGLAPLTPTIVGHIRNVRASGLFYKRDIAQHDPDLLTPKAGVIAALNLTNLETKTPLVVENVFADTTQYGIQVTGEAEVIVNNFNLTNATVATALCGSNCKLTVDGEVIQQTTSVKL